MLDQLGGRKFLLTLIVIAVGTAVQMFSPHGVTEAFTALLIGVTATFGAANAVVSLKAMGQPASEPAPEVDLTAVHNAVESVANSANHAMQVAQQAQSIAASQAETIESLKTGVLLAQKAAQAALQVRQ